MGIPTEKTSSLFKPFSQVDRSTTRRFGGTGLGLSICHKLVDLMGGKIGVNSKEGEGSTFWFNIILNKAEKPDRSLQIPKLNGTALLIAPKGPDLMSSIMLRNLGLEVCEADNAAMALDLLAKRDLKAVVADYGLGFDECLNLAGQAKNLKAETPLLAIVPQVISQGDLKSLNEAGYKNALIKPVKILSLAGAVSGRLARAVDALSHNPLAEEVDGAASFRILLVEDNPVNQLVAQGLLSRMGYSSDLAANGWEALETLSKNNYDMVLMDCQMPVMDGYEATQKIRQGKHGIVNVSVPIVAMTAHAMSGDREKCLAAGMNDYISKPIYPRRLKDILERWLPHQAKSI